MTAAEAYQRSISDAIRAKVKADRDRQVGIILKKIFREVNNCIENGHTGFYFHADSEYYGFGKWEKLALEELKEKGYRVKKGWWPINNTWREISWDHVEIVPANDVVKGLL